MVILILLTHLTTAQARRLRYLDLVAWASGRCEPNAQFKLDRRDAQATGNDGGHSPPDESCLPLKKH